MAEEPAKAASASGEASPAPAAANSRWNVTASLDAALDA